MHKDRKTVVVIHTSFVSVTALTDLFTREAPDLRLHHIVDDSLLAEVMAYGDITPGIVRRMCTYARNAEEIGADLIFNQCSSVGEAVDLARRIVSVPILKVDEAMAEEAVSIGPRIAVVATVASTMKPSTNLVQSAALKAGKTIDIREILVDGALEILMKQGDRNTHNRLVRQAVESAATDCDVVVLAQGSMIVLLEELGHIPVPVLSSPRSGVHRAVQILSQN